MYCFYEEIFFLDEFFVWNNHKNGNLWSWYDINKPALCEVNSDQ